MWVALFLVMPKSMGRGDVAAAAGLAGEGGTFKPREGDDDALGGDDGGRIDLVAGPTRHGAELAQRAEVKERGVANDLVLIATDPQQRRRLLDVSEAGSVAPRW